MKEIGIRYLKSKASELVNKVAESHTSYVITKRGKPVGVLAPADHLTSANNQSSDDAWDNLLSTTDKIASKTKGKSSAVAEVSRMRR